MALQVSSEVVKALLAQAEAARPRECCGIMLGEGDRITAIRPADNVHLQPETHFEIDPQVLIDTHRAARSGGPQITGYYHSHPNGLPHPSDTDRAMAAADGAIWAIIAASGVRFFRSGAGGFTPLPYEVLDS